MTIPDFSKMSTREIFEWQYKNKPQMGEECELVGIEKQVWESTLNRSMVLQAENNELTSDCKTLARKLLQVKPELREWLEVNYKEYL